MADSNEEPTDRAAVALEISAFVASVIPYIGGPLENILGGFGSARRLNRVRDTIRQVASRLNELKAEVSEQYVSSEEFEELLERTLRMAADERNDAKRRLYADALANDIVSGVSGFDEKLRLLRTLEELQLDHVRLLRALCMPPQNSDGLMGSPIDTLRHRLPDLPSSHIEELVGQLNALQLTNMRSLQVMMTAHGAQNLAHTVTDYGKRLMTYVSEA